MLTTTYQPWGLMNQFRQDMEKFFDHYNRQSEDQSAIATCAWVPAVDIKEEGQQFVIEADIPGVEPKDIEVSMDNGVLTIKGERQSESQDEGQNYKRVERTYGSFYRRFSLPDTADAEHIQASGKNGVLQISIPKRELAKPRKISVQA
jgi:HSP20 family protein